MSKAYSYKIKSQISQEYQSSPAWVVTFLRWTNRDTFRFNSSPGSETGAPDQLETRDLLVVINDCISIDVSDSKSSHTPEAQLILKAGDINYMTAVAPGDFFFVNMLKSEKEADRIAELAQAGKPINDIKSGFKGFFKVQSVRQSLSISPENGMKQLVFQIQGYAFTEFNNTVYFNPHLLEFGQKQNDYLFVSNLGSIWQKMVGNKLLQNVQDLVSLLIDTIIGVGLKNTSLTNQDSKVKGFNFNTHFYLPSKVGSLLGIKGAKSAKDVIFKIFGRQSYSGAETQDPSVGFQPSSLSPCSGSMIIKAEYWNQVALWSIMQQYANIPINEMYTCFRLNKEGSIVPTFVMRQTPFSTEGFQGRSTKFLSLPRWNVDSELIKSVNLGRDESARINFVQVFGRTQSDDPNASISNQVGQGNYEIDVADIRRNGLKPYIITSNADTVQGNTTLEKGATSAPYWAKLLGDALIGGHLKLNGSISCMGIVEPICVGDNFQLGSVVYHIESVSHRASISPDGTKDFTTMVQLSNGIDEKYEATNVRYAKNDNVDMLKEREEDFNNEDILPGISDEQSISRLPNLSNVVRPSNVGFNLQTKKINIKSKKKGRKK